MSMNFVTDQNLWKPLTLALQFSFLLVLFGHATGIFDLDKVVCTLWRWIYFTRFFHNSIAEATVGAVSFFSWIVFFRAVDSVAVFQRFRLVPRPMEEGWPVPIQDFLDAVTSYTKGHLSYRHARIFRVTASLPVYLFAIMLLHLIRQGKSLEEQSPSFLRLLGELIFGIWAYDFLFFWLHLAMHRWPHLGHNHLEHHGWRDGGHQHSDRFLEAENVVQHSLVDGAAQVFTNILVQNIAHFGMGRHKLSRFLHNVLVTYLLTEAHSGLDLPWGSHRLFPKLLGGAPRHELHHHSHRYCYQQFFTYLDELLGHGPPQKSE